MNIVPCHSSSSSSFNYLKQHPFSVLEGSVWCAFLIHYGVDLVKRAQSYSSQTQREADSLKKLSQASYSLLGSLAGVLSWANKTAFIPLGKFFPVVSGIGYFSTLASSGISYLDNLHILNKGIEGDSNRTSANRLKELRQQKNLTLLRLALHASFVAWAILGLATLFIASSGLSAIFNFFLLQNVLLFSGETVYSYHIKKHQKAPVPTAT